MKTTIGGVILTILGILGVYFWYPDVLSTLKGFFPLLFILFGGLLLYLGYGELKEATKQHKINKAASTEAVDQYRQEIENLKKEIELLRTKEVQEGIPPWMSDDIDLGDSDKPLSQFVQTGQYDLPENK